MSENINPNPNGAAIEVQLTPQEIFQASYAKMREGNQKEVNTKEEIVNTVETEEDVDNGVDESDQVSQEDQNVESEDNSPSDDVSDKSEDNVKKQRVIDFKELADASPNQKFRFMRGDKEIIIDAKKAFSILGQGAVVSEEARELKIQKAAFDEERQEKENHYGNLLLALEFTAEPRLKEAADGLNDKIKYMRSLETLYNQHREDPVAEVEIGSVIRELGADIEKDKRMILELRPKVSEYRKRKADSIAEEMEKARVSFEDKELKNKVIYEELTEKLIKEWPSAKKEQIPGIPNLSIIMSDEKILSLVRDGLKYRAKPNSKQVGSSVAATLKEIGSTSKPKPKTIDKSAAIRKGDMNTSLEIFNQVLNQGRRKPLTSI